MRCRYREKIYRCGDYFESEIFPVFHKGGGKIHRRSKYKPTSAMQARLNQRRAEEALTRILNENFTENDIEITLTYADEYLPKDYEKAIRDADNYIRRVKRLRQKRGLEAIRFVRVPGGGRYHFHIVMSGGIDRDELEQMWGYGYANSKRLKFSRGSIGGLAHYDASQLDEGDAYGGEDLFSLYDIDEETGEATEKARERKKGQKRWSCSKNLRRPKPEIREGRISAARVEELATVDSLSRTAFEKLYPGYSFNTCEPYYNPENGGYYLRVRMYRTRQRDVKRRMLN